MLEPDEAKVSRPVLRGLATRQQAIDGTGTFTPLDPQSCRLLLTVLSLPPRRSVMSHRSARAMPCCLRPVPGSSASGSKFFRGHLWVYFRCWDRPRVRQLLGEGLPFLPFRLQGGFTIPPWLRFARPPL